MKIVRDAETATYTLVPVETEEEQILLSMIGVLNSGDKIRYAGMSRGDEKFCKINLHAGGRAEWKTHKTGLASITKRVQVDSVKLVLCGTTEEDGHNANRLNGVCFYSGGLIFLGTTEVDGKKAIITTGALCNLCGGQMIDQISCEWEICNACSAKCGHRYERGLVHGSRVDIGVGAYCGICGRGKPKAEGEQEMSLENHHLAAEDFGITIISI
jgi:hypothetical protein